MFSSLIAHKELLAFPVKQRFYEIGSKEGLAEFEDYILRMRYPCSINGIEWRV
jgi:hypothetical protein